EVIAVGTKKRPPKSPTGTFIRPFWGRYTSGFGSRTLFGVRRKHEGLDFAGPTGSPIVASDGGVVTFAGRRSGYGLCVVISHGKGITTLYGHCSKLLVRVGQAVAQGERIANVGSTGRSTGPHLHFEVRVNDVPRNPWNYLG
ncbi:MAG: M23 family metallopeptidase, partial [Oscillospiraceae bacterium]|nr:M23 family metallopeptidase [Oscillospiraceae bacterium]